METIHVKFDELTSTASEQNSSEPAFHRFNDDSPVVSMNTPSKDDFDNLFGPMQDSIQEALSSSSSIYVDEQEDPPLVSSSNEQTIPLSFSEADEFIQEDSAELDGNTLITPYDALNFSEAESSTAINPLNMHDTMEPKNIKEAMSDHSWIESMQKELHQFERLAVWELVPRPEGKNIFALKWLWKNKRSVCHPDHVYRLKKALYGLKQAPRACLVKFDGKSDEGFFVGYAIRESFRVQSLMNLQVHKENLMQVHQKKSVKIALRSKSSMEYGLNNEMLNKANPDDDCSPKEVNAAGQHVNTTSPDVTTGSFKLNAVATHVEFFSDEDEPKVDLGNITNSYTVPTTPNTRIHKDHPIENVIGDVKSSVQTRRMTKPTCSQGFSVEELLQFKLYRFGYLWICLLERGPLEQKMFFRNKKDERGIVLEIKQVGAQVQNKKKELTMRFISPVARTSRPDIMFAVCACARFQVTPKTSHLLAVKRIFRYLKGKPTLGLWYSRDSPFELVAYTDSDYAGATQDRKSTTRAEYVAAASCCGQVLWIQNQLLDYGYNFMHTVINIDNNNLFTKGFDAGRFQYLVSSIGMLNP
ncbi:hypothetical protein Tco_0557260 [Tanacetum coccineum]